MMCACHIIPEWKKKGKGLRLGQWWLNTYDPKAINPALFYEKDTKVAYGMIFALYCYEKETNVA
jgi:hypothetical protein